MTSPATAPGTPFLSRTPATIFVTAIEHRGVLGDGFQSVALPAARDNAKFLFLVSDGHCPWIHALPSVDSNRKVEGRENSDHTERIRDCPELGSVSTMQVPTRRESLALKNAVTWSLGRDDPPVHHPRQTDGIISLRLVCYTTHVDAYSDALCQ